METHDRDRRAHAIGQLKRLRVELERSQKIDPDPRAPLPAVLAERLVEALGLALNELGDDWCGVYYYHREKLVRAPTRKGGNPIVDAVDRDALLGQVNHVLKRLGVED